jgi:hypothetical protein
VVAGGVDGRGEGFRLGGGVVGLTAGVVGTAVGVVGAGTGVVGAAAVVGAGWTKRGPRGSGVAQPASTAAAATQIASVRRGAADTRPSCQMHVDAREPPVRCEP